MYDRVHPMQEKRFGGPEKKYGDENGHEKSPSLEKFLQERLVQQNLENNVAEMTKTLGNMMGISQYPKRDKNMTRRCPLPPRPATERPWRSST